MRCLPNNFMVNGHIVLYKIDNEGRVGRVTIVETDEFCGKDYKFTYHDGGWIKNDKGECIRQYLQGVFPADGWGPDGPETIRLNGKTYVLLSEEEHTRYWAEAGVYRD